MSVQPNTTKSVSSPTRRRLAAVATAAVVAAGGLVLYEVSTAPDLSGAAGVSIDKLPDVGEVLVDANGNTLYMFEPDEASSVTCTGDCADKWPPLTLTEGTELKLEEGVRKDLIGEAVDEAGTPVVTYAGWPLYRYDSDSAGEASGHEVDENGGEWFAVTTDGERAD